MARVEVAFLVGCAQVALRQSEIGKLFYLRHAEWMQTVSVCMYTEKRCRIISWRQKESFITQMYLYC